MLFVSFTKGPGGFPYVFIIAGKIATLIPIDGITLGDHGVFVLGGDQEVFDGAARMRNLHQFILENYRIELLRLLRDWERLQFRQCNYKNHRIFTLRCLHNDLVPVSIKLKSTLKSKRARKILRRVEKQLLQIRLKSTNSLLDNTKELELTRSKIASILMKPNYQQCQEFIEKIRRKDSTRFEKDR